MKTIQRFTFCYPVSLMTAKGPICLDTLTVDAVATLRPDGDVRTVDIDVVRDGEGNIITKFMPFIECMEGDLNKALESAAMEHITGMLELQAKKPDLFVEMAKIIYPEYLAEA